MASDRVNLERALLAAIDDNDLPTAESLILSGADVNRRGPLPLTPLMRAAGRGSTQMVGKLLAAGADVHAIDSTMGASALHFAAQGGVVDIARLLLDAGAFINLQSATVGLTPLITAIWAKQVPMVRFLLGRGAAIDIKTHLGGASAWDFVGQDVLWTAGFTQPEAENWGRQIRALLEEQRKADEAVVARQRLMSAVQAGDLATVQQLIADGVDVNEKSPVLANGNDGQTPLLVACFLGHGAIVRALVAAGADPRINDYLLGATPAHKAAYAVGRTRWPPSGSTAGSRSTPRDRSMAIRHCTMPFGTAIATPSPCSSTGPACASTCAAWTAGLPRSSAATSATPSWPT
jgi:ankyrin repeat protein